MPTSFPGLLEFLFRFPLQKLCHARRNFRWVCAESILGGFPLQKQFKDLGKVLGLLPSLEPFQDLQTFHFGFSPQNNFQDLLNFFLCFVLGLYSNSKDRCSSGFIAGPGKKARQSENGCLEQYKSKTCVYTKTFLFVSLQVGEKNKHGGQKSAGEIFKVERSV